jgi:hypothetical protein
VKKFLATLFIAGLLLANLGCSSTSTSGGTGGSGGKPATGGSGGSGGAKP